MTAVGPWPDEAMREEYRGNCLACMIEAEIGSEETPHPIPERWHTCGGRIEKTPADRLADVLEDHLIHLRTSSGACGSDCYRDLREALEAYRSTRNGVGQTMDRALGSPPDPVKVARLMLDVLTGGALASLICQVMDFALPCMNGSFGNSATRYARENIKANLHALGEKIE